MYFTNPFEVIPTVERVLEKSIYSILSLDYITIDLVLQTTKYVWDTYSCTAPGGCTTPDARTSEADVVAQVNDVIMAELFHTANRLTETQVCLADFASQTDLIHTIAGYLQMVNNNSPGNTLFLAGLPGVISPLMHADVFKTTARCTYTSQNASIVGGVHFHSGLQAGVLQYIANTNDRFMSENLLVIRTHDPFVVPKPQKVDVFRIPVDFGKVWEN